MEESVSFADLNSKIDDLEGALKPFIESSWTKSTEGMDEFQKAKLSVLLAYSANALFYGDPLWTSSHRAVYLKAQGVNPLKHPVKEDLVRFAHRVVTGQDRIQQTMTRLNETSKPAESSTPRQ